MIAIMMVDYLVDSFQEKNFRKELQGNIVVEDSTSVMLLRSDRCETAKTFVWSRLRRDILVIIAFAIGKIGEPTN